MQRTIMKLSVHVRMNQFVLIRVRVNDGGMNRGVGMKMRVALLLLVAIFVLSVGARVAAQEKSAVLVKGSELNNGVVIVSVTKGTKTFELQCNKDAPNCASLKSGKYVMVELPPNRGMYECRDVQVFPEAAVSTDPEHRIGEYCMVEN